MIISAVLLRFGGALLLTFAVEAAAAWLLGLRTARGQLMLLLINTITNPLLNLVVNVLAAYAVYVVRSPFDPVLLAMEAAVIAVEALLLKLSLGLPAGRAVLFSAVVNAASWLAGALILWQL